MIKTAVNIQVLKEFRTPTSSTNISRKLGRHKSTVIRMKKRMLKLDFVEFTGHVKQDWNRRHKYYQITEKGLQYLELMKPLTEEGK